MTLIKQKPLEFSCNKMRAIKACLLSIFLILLGILEVNAQSNKIYKFGLIAGVNANQIESETSGLTHLLWRYNVGLTMEQQFTRSFALAYELLYSRQGGVLYYSGNSASTGSTTEKEIISFDYAALPILARFRPKGERTFIEVGGQVGYLVANKYYFASASHQALPFYHRNSFDAGLTGGVGFRFSKHLTLEARYYHGLKPILGDYTQTDPQTGIATYYRADKWYNRNYLLNVSYFF